MALSSILAKHLPSCGKSTKSKHFTFNFFLNFVKFSCLPTLTQSEGGGASSTELNGSSFKGRWQRMVTFSTIPLISAEQLGCDHHKSGAKLGMATTGTCGEGGSSQSSSSGEPWGTPSPQHGGDGWEGAALAPMRKILPRKVGSTPAWCGAPGR